MSGGKFLTAAAGSVRAPKPKALVILEKMLRNGFLFGQN
jgi:hypothetical protein